MIVTTDELYHYGVLGMKWGVRHDKPTSGRRRSSAKTKASSSKRSVASSISKVKGARIGSADTDMMVDIAVSVLEVTAITALAFAPRIARAIKYRKVNPDHKVSHNIKSDAKPVELNKGTNTSESPETTVTKINTDYPKPGTTQNCVSCSYAYDLARRGYNVEARKMKFGFRDNEIKQISDAEQHQLELSDDYRTELKSAKSFALYSKAGRQATDKLYNELASQGDGARGMVTVSWMWGGGHAMAWENSGGTTKVYDAQSGKSYTADEFHAKFSYDIDYMYDTPKYYRLDNATYNENVYNMVKFKD